MNLHENREIFKELVALAGDKFEYENSHVEKDYWVSKVLKDVHSSGFAVNAYFKGGTSLSKAYSLIDRFSEDLDLFVFTGDVQSSKHAEKTLNRKLSKFIAKANADIYKEDLSEIGGNYRKLYFAYDSVFPTVGLKDFLEVEIKSSDLADKNYLYCPFERRVISPIITDYLIGEGRQDLIMAYGLSSFEFQCINPRKTICDKISRLVKISYKDDFVEQLVKHIRDVYDLAALYEIDEYKEFLHSDDFFEAMNMVLAEDRLSKLPCYDMPLSDAEIFKNAGKVMNQTAVLESYTIDLRKLIFDKNKHIELDSAICALNDLHEILLVFDRYAKA